jgi:hypothetical protein
LVQVPEIKSTAKKADHSTETGAEWAGREENSQQMWDSKEVWEEEAWWPHRTNEFKAPDTEWSTTLLTMIRQKPQLLTETWDQLLSSRMCNRSRDKSRRKKELPQGGHPLTDTTVLAPTKWDPFLKAPRASLGNANAEAEEKLTLKIPRPINSKLNAKMVFVPTTSLLHQRNNLPPQWEFVTSLHHQPESFRDHPLHKESPWELLLPRRPLRKPLKLYSLSKNLREPWLRTTCKQLQS